MNATNIITFKGRQIYGASHGIKELTNPILHLVRNETTLLLVLECDEYSGYIISEVNKTLLDRDSLAVTVGDHFWILLGERDFNILEKKIWVEKYNIKCTQDAVEVENIEELLPQEYESDDPDKIIAEDELFMLNRGRA